LFVGRVCRRQSAHAFIRPSAHTTFHRLFWPSPAVLAQVGICQLWRPGRADRHHAHRTGGAASLDFGKAFSACAQLLHGAPGARGAAAGHLHRLAHAPWLGRGGGGWPVRVALAVPPDRAVLALHCFWRTAVGGRAVLRHQTSPRPSWCMRRTALARAPCATAGSGRLLPRPSSQFLRWTCLSR